ncbi:unnamed protein product [Heligmosomoides polygyrus]|uniref:Globin family profile domain-containing protein n=1 Tax=Heligmosomoides polygyrus TaxID=6339 RepID=A0A183G4J4_HELPZ|nr:unnamed protein product [Heligmosomoides polygyrus]
MEGLVGLGGKSEPGTWYRVHATVAPPPTALHAPILLPSRHVHFRASSNIDVGCELVARLLNDSRTRFRALIESHSGDMLGSEIFTAESVKKIRRARSVGEGVVAFFSQIVSELDQPNALDLIKLQSQSLGASHFRMKVWFQAENWLCVKNCLLETIISGLSVKSE